MEKEELLILIETFMKETWKYKESNELDKDMDYIYTIYDELRKNENIDTKQIYNKLLATIGTIRLKYGLDSIIINTNNNLKEKISKISLTDEDLINEYKTIERMYTEYVKEITNVDFLQIQRNSTNEGLYLALESLKSLITNKEYRDLLKDGQIREILIDCIKIINGIDSFKKIESKYKKLIQKIWEQSLSNYIDKKSFILLFENISGPLLEQAFNLINRSDQSSCSMISSNFIATYLGHYRRIGFIHPNNSNIITASAYDLASNVFGLGVKNKEKGTSLVTPIVLEKIGVERAKAIGEDLLSSSCYNEVCVDSKPCGIIIIGFGEKDLNIDYEDIITLANKLKLPISTIDIMDYKTELSEADKEYIAYHCILSYMDISAKMMNKLPQTDEESKLFTLILTLIDEYKDEIAQKFIELKTLGTLNRESMFQSLANIIDISKTNALKK